MLSIAKKDHVDGFSKAWTHKGIAIFLDNVHKQFALDFANMIVTSFVQQQQTAARAAAEKAKIKVVED